MPGITLAFWSLINANGQAAIPLLVYKCTPAELSAARCVSGVLVIEMGGLELDGGSGGRGLPETRVILMFLRVKAVDSSSKEDEPVMVEAIRQYRRLVERPFMRWCRKQTKSEDPDGKMFLVAWSDGATTPLACAMDSEVTAEDRLSRSVRCKHAAAASLVQQPCVRSSLAGVRELKGWVRSGRSYRE